MGENASYFVKLPLRPASLWTLPQAAARELRPRVLAAAEAADPHARRALVLAEEYAIRADLLLRPCRAGNRLLQTFSDPPTIR